MGLNNTDSLRVVLDIETAPLPDCADYLDLSQFSAPSNWKDPDKIQANVKEQQDAAIARAALDVDLCQIVAIGFQREDWNEPEVITLNDEPGHTKEAAMLAD